MKTLSIVVATAALLLSNAAIAIDGHDWRAASAVNRLKEVQRILDNIRSKGCVVKLSPEYYVRQLDDLYASKSTLSLQTFQAVALVATGAGEVWKC